MLLLLSGCGGRINPFDKNADMATPENVVPPLAITSLDGLGPGDIERFSGLLREHTRRQGIAQATASTSKSSAVRLSGQLSTAPARNGRVIAYAFDVVSPHTGGRTRISGTRTFSAAGNQVQATDAVLEDVAAETTDKLVEWLVAQGVQFATPTLPPPEANFAKAPTRARAIKTRIAAGAGADPAGLVTGSIGDPGAIRTAERPVSIGTVTGVDDAANQVLIRAISRALADAGVATSEGTGGKGYVLSAAVRLGALSHGRREIAIDWRLNAPDGRTIGSVSQNNAVPQSALEDGWTDTATRAADAAAPGLIEILRTGT